MANIAKTRQYLAANGGSGFTPPFWGERLSLLTQLSTQLMLTSIGHKTGFPSR
jgi:hypothetical protein